jgi:hypothetical protein
MNDKMFAWWMELCAGWLNPLRWLMWLWGVRER